MPDFSGAIRFFALRPSADYVALLVGQLVERGAQGVSRGAIKPGFHLFACPEGRMTGLRYADRRASFRISPKGPSRPSLDGKCSEATYLHSIASDQCRNDLVENDAATADEGEK